MTISQAISAVNYRNPNAFSEEMKATILCALEARLIYEFTGEVKNVSYPEYVDEPLILPERYSEIYVVYLSAMVCFWNKEYEEYNNHVALFGSLLSQYREESRGCKKRFFNLF